ARERCAGGGQCAAASPELEDLERPRAVERRPDVERLSAEKPAEGRMTLGTGDEVAGRTEAAQVGVVAVARVVQRRFHDVPKRQRALARDSLAQERLQRGGCHASEGSTGVASEPRQSSCRPPRWDSPPPAPQPRAGPPSWPGRCPASPR